MAKLIFDHNISINNPQNLLKNKILWITIIFLISGYFTACAPQESASPKISKPATSTWTVTPTTIKQPTITTRPESSPTHNLLTSTVDENSTTKKIVPVSPLDSILIEELVNLISNPFQSPSFGQDDGHHGVDIAFYSYREFESIDNHPVLSIFPGRISTVIFNRPPYGNAIIIETEFISIEDNILSKIDQLNLTNEIRTSSFLNCPDYSETDFQGASKKESLYVLYGHLKNSPTFEIGEEIALGEIIGNVGNSGNSGNPHLHLETRIGPSHATFNTLAHYDNSATLQEMKNYCLWRVSNLFSLFDPIIIFESQPTKP